MSKIVWLTDLHLRAATDPLAMVMEERLKRCLEHIGAHHADASLCVIGGDIGNTGQAAEYTAFQRIMSGCRLPWRVLAGNHDNRLALRATAASQTFSGTETLVGVESLAEAKVLFLDTQKTGSSAGTISDDDLLWLDRELAVAETPALIFMHHQPTPVFIPSIDTLGLDNPEALEAVLLKHRSRIAHIFFGHCHLPISGSLAGIGFTGLPATTIQQAANFDTTEFIADPIGEPAYGVIFVKGSNVVCHTVHVRED